MLNTFSHLSVWEIACRINGADPDLVDESNIPLAIKDTLRGIARAFDYDENFSLLNSTGLENYPFADELIGKRFSHDDVRQELRRCYVEGVFNKYWLNLAYAHQEHIGDWCIRNKFPLPSFWFPAGWPNEENISTDSQPASEPTRPAQIDKALCQAIAKTLWEIYPETNIADMCKHNAIQRHGNGRLYAGAHTLRDWLSEVAPENIKGKRGRPKKAETQQ